MPQATEEDRAKYSERFGDIDCNHACAELKRRGYILSRDFRWHAPKGHTPTEDEAFWIGFLVDEWDFGGLNGLLKPDEATSPNGK